MKRSPVTVANEVVPIVAVCRWLGVDVPDDDGGRSKLYCPFGDFNHSDAGRDRAMRIYPDSNSAYCFACSETFTPVKLYARATDTSNWTAAALTVLGKIGYSGYDPTVAWQQAISYEPVIDRSRLAEALKTFCRRIEPAWTTRQFEQPIAAQLTRCLILLDLVMNAQDALLWLARCKVAMQVKLYAGHSYDRQIT